MMIMVIMMMAVIPVGEIAVVTVDGGVIAHFQLRIMVSFDAPGHEVLVHG